MSQITSFLTLLPPSPYLPLSGRSGKLPFSLTNDYLFKAVLQTDESVLRSLLCSLLDLNPDDICSVTITNALILGANIKDKDTFLDIRLVLNDCRLINLEMQMKNGGDWPERSLYYLCRAFNNLETGALYPDVKPAHHIGILNFSLPHVQKQFYSHYFMINEATHEVFSDKLRLSVLNLTQTALATEHDRHAGLTRWAAAFKAGTWEEYQMLAEEDSIFEKVSDALYLLSENREVAEQCLRMQEAAAERKYWENIKEQLVDAEKTLAEKERAIAEKDNTIAEKDNALAEKDNALAEKDNALAEKNAELEHLKAQLRQYREQDRQD